MENRTIAAVGTMLALLCAGCSEARLPSAGAAPASAGSAAPAARRKASVTFRFKIPRPRHRHGVRYLSPATASIAVSVLDSHGHPSTQATFETMPAQGDCTALFFGTFTCTFVMSSIPPGYDTFNIAAYDGVNAQGNRLSASSSPQFVQAGEVNGVDIALGGIPASLAVAIVGSSPFAAGSAASGFQFGGIGSGAMQQLQVTAKDADGYSIINPGAPALTLTSSAPAKLAVTVPGGAGLFDVTPLAETNALPTPLPGTAVTLTATATPATGTGTNPLTVDVSVQNDPIAYVANTGSAYVEAYAPWSSSPVLSLNMYSPPTLPDIAVDVSGNVYVSDDGGSVVNIFPVGSGTTTNTLHVNDPEFIAVDASLNVYVDSQSGGDVVEYNPANGNQLVRTLAADEPYGIALDGAGNLYSANCLGSDGISVYPAGTSTTPSFSFSNGMSCPTYPTFDAAGNLYVTNSNTQKITEYTPSFSAASSAVNTFGTGQLSQPYGIAVDGPGNVYVANYNPQNILQFGPATPTTVSRTLTDGNRTENVAVDPLGNVYIAWGGGPVDVFPPASSGSSTKIDSWTTDTDNPFNVAVWP